MADIKTRIASLTPRQIEILQLVAQRYNSKEIALRLKLSPNTVDAHIATALQRLDVATRRDAVLALIENGLLAGPVTAQPTATIQAAPPAGFHSGNPLMDDRTLSPSENERLSTPAPTRAGLLPIVRWLSNHKNGDRENGAYPQFGMAKVVLRYVLDAFYISIFFAIMSGVAFGAHLIVIECEQGHIDPVVLLILHAVSYALVVLDAIGVTSATALLTYRFIRAIVRADD